MIDSHAHLNFEAFKDDYKEVIKRSFNNGLEGIINIGTRLDNSMRAIDISKEFNEVYAAIGFHPDHLNEIETGNIDSEIEKFRTLAENPKVVAIGEIGLDNYYFKSGKLEDSKGNREKAEEIFEKMLNLASEVNLPVIIHSREAEKETLFIIKNWKLKIKNFPGGVIHCFSGSLEFAKKILSLGFYIGFTGIPTYPNTKELANVIKNVPLDRILIETDCPFLAPQAYRGKRCEPWHVKEIAKKIAEIKDISKEEVEKSTIKNTKTLFNI